MDGLQNLPDEVRQYILYLEKKIQELEQRLKMYENPHTPPSQQRFKNNASGKNPPGKRGAPPGHHGATRTTPEPDEIIPVTLDLCPQCGSYLGAATRIEQRTIEEPPPPQKIKVTQYNIHHYHCPECGTEIKATHPDCPHTGNFGVRLMTQVTLMKYRQRCVLRRIEESLWDQHQFPITPKGIHDILLRVGDALVPEYQRQQHQVRRAPYRYTDETSSSVMGKNHWLWLSRSDTNIVSLLIHPSRGRQALEHLLGDTITGVDVNDGWSSYRRLPETQRCWAHLLREVDHGNDFSNHEQTLSTEMHRRFDALKDFIGKDPPMKERIEQKEIWDKELQTLVNEYIEYPDVRVKVQYIKNGLSSWHTCLLHPGMQPTNNLAEQAIREHVIQRKIIGCFRSERGAENYQYIASVLATWRLQGKNVSEEVENLLRREMCLSQS